MIDTLVTEVSKTLPNTDVYLTQHPKEAYKLLVIKGYSENDAVKSMSIALPYMESSPPSFVDDRLWLDVPDGKLELIGNPPPKYHAKHGFFELDQISFHPYSVATSTLKLTVEDITMLVERLYYRLRK